MKYYFPIIILTLVFTGCSKHKAKKQAKDDDAIIQEYITDHNLTATTTESGLYVVVENLGSGASCTNNSTVKVAYKGYFTDGSVFDESSTAGISFGLQSVIQGWTEGIPHFKEGGNGILLIPSALGYGSNANGPIPANSVLIFDVSLIEVL